MLRQNDQIDAKKPVLDDPDAAPDVLPRSKAGARRTAWIIGAIAIAFFIASLVQGHLVHIPS